MKAILLGALSAGKHHTGRGGKTGVLQVLILIRIVDASLTALAHSERVSMYYPQHFVHCLAKSWSASIAILELCFQFMD